MNKQKALLLLLLTIFMAVSSYSMTPMSAILPAEGGTFKIYDLKYSTYYWKIRAHQTESPLSSTISWIVLNPADNFHIAAHLKIAGNLNKACEIDSWRCERHLVVCYDGIDIITVITMVEHPLTIVGLATDVVDGVMTIRQCQIVAKMPDCIAPTGFNISLTIVHDNTVLAIVALVINIDSYIEFMITTRLVVNASVIT